MRAGCSRVAITPPVGVELSGYGLRQQPSVGVHDDLFARALYIEAENEKLLWLHCDLVGIDQVRVRELRRRLVEECGLSERQILVSATHTHAGPAAVQIAGCGEMSPPYLAQLDERLLQAARRALREPVEVTLCFAEGRCDLGIDRRATATAHVDHLLPVIGLKKPGGSFLAVLANYAVHNVALSHNNRLISADLAGAAAAVAGAKLDGNPEVFVTNGGCGNINPPAQSDDFSAAEKFGGELGNRIVELGRRARACTETGLASSMETVDVPLSLCSVDEVEQEYHRMMDDQAGRFSSDFHRIQMKAWRDRTVEAIEEGSAPDSVESDLQAVRIGPARFAAIGAEVFSRMADELRAAAGVNVYVVGYANGVLGYLPFREAYAEGGYEVDYAYKLYGNFNLKPGSFELLRDGAIQLLRRIEASR